MNTALLDCQTIPKIAMVMMRPMIPRQEGDRFLASGGAYAEGPAKAYDFVEPYLRAVLGFVGITDVTVVRVENQANPDMAQKARAGAADATQALAA